MVPSVEGTPPLESYQKKLPTSPKVTMDKYSHQDLFASLRGLWPTGRIQRMNRRRGAKMRSYQLPPTMSSQHPCPLAEFYALGSKRYHKSFSYSEFLLKTDYDFGLGTLYLT